MVSTHGRDWDFGAIREGWEVFDAHDNKVGDILDIRGDHFTLAKGVVFTSKRYVPRSAVSRIADTKVYLNVAAEEIESRGWDRPPSTTDQAAAPHSSTGANARHGSPGGWQPGERPIHPDDVPLDEEGHAVDWDADRHPRERPIHPDDVQVDQEGHAADREHPTA